MFRKFNNHRSNKKLIWLFGQHFLINCKLGDIFTYIFKAHLAHPDPQVTMHRTIDKFDYEFNKFKVKKARMVYQVVIIIIIHRH